MSPKRKRQYFAAVAICFVVFFLIMLGLLTTVGEELAIFTILLPLVAYVVVLAIIRSCFARSVFNDTQQAILILENDCDPERFVHACAPLVGSPKPVMPVQTVWLMSYYTRGLAEAGYLEDACELYDCLRANLRNWENKPQHLAAMYVSLAPVTRMLLGGRYALQALEQAEQILRSAGLVDDSPRGDYQRWERGNLCAQRDGNLEVLERRMREAADNERCSWLVRVECAERESWVHRARGNVQAECERLRFVIEHGGSLSCVTRARARLAAI